MYNINGIGNRIARWRKLSGYTQEELAERLNITAQAVSKWENELSFPEITLLPEIARVLNTSMDRLFGNESVQQNADTSSITFPEYQGHLKLVQVYNEIACYSNKEVDLTTETSVVFANGSTADLSKLEILNKGTGEIIFVSDEGQLVHAMNEAVDILPMAKARGFWYQTKLAYRCRSYSFYPKS